MYGLNKYGDLQYSEKSKYVPSLNECDFNLISHLPKVLQSSIMFSEIYKASEIELCALQYHIGELDLQMNLDTATWGLSVYEKELGIVSNYELTFEDRRELIKAKLWGIGTSTLDMIKHTAISFSGGEVRIIEHHSEYRFTVQFIGIKGIPRNMQSFINILETIKPAHLAYDFKYTYNVWDNINMLTWNELSNMTWDDLKVYE